MTRYFALLYNFLFSSCSWSSPSVPIVSRRSLPHQGPINCCRICPGTEGRRWNCRCPF